MSEANNSLPKIPDADLEKAVMGGIRATIKYLQRDMPTESITKHVNAASDDPDYTRSASFLLGHKDRHKATLFAAALQDIAPRISKRLGDRVTSIEIKANEDEVVSISHDIVENAFAQKALDGFRGLRVYANHVASREIRNWYQEAVAANDPIAVDLTTELVLRYDVKHLPHDVMLNGFVTASDTIWGLLNTIPTVYEAQFDAPITQKDLDAILPAAKTLAQVLATMRLDVLVHGFFPAVMGEHKSFVKKLILNGLELKRDGDTWTIDFSEKVLRTMIAKFNARSDTAIIAGRHRLLTKCPALYVFGDDEQNMIGSYFDKAHAMTKEYYYPTIAKE